MRLFFLIVIIILISTFKAELDKKNTKDKSYKNIFDEMKKEIINQKEIIELERKRGKIPKDIFTTEKKSYNIKDKVVTQTNIQKPAINNTINDYYDEILIEDANKTENLINKNLETNNNFAIKKDLKINPKRAFIYSEIFNRKY